MSITVKTITKLNLAHGDKFDVEIFKISRRGSRSSDNAEVSHFTLFFCRGRQRNVPGIIVIMHVHSDCSVLYLLFSDVPVAVAVVVILNSLISQRYTCFNIQKKDTSSFVSWGRLSNYSILNDSVNGLISTLLTKEYISASGDLHADSNNNEDPCCDSSAVTSPSGRENLYRDSSEGRR